MKEELGDLLLQVVFHAQIAKDRGEFDINDVIDKISDKMVSRHPHVFGDAKFRDPRGSHESSGKTERGKRESLKTQPLKECLRNCRHF